MIPVVVYWVDAVSPEGGWQAPDQIEVSLRTVATVGFLAIETDELIGIAQDRDQEGNLNGIGTIPRSCVERIVRLVPEE